jgi:uncharacterized protein YihD (DUF1040 family)
MGVWGKTPLGPAHGDRIILCLEVGFEMDAISVIAIVTGVSGLLASGASIVFQAIKENREMRRLKIGKSREPGQIANDLILSARNLTELQEAVYEKSLGELKDEIVALHLEMEKKTAELVAKIDELAKQAETNRILISRLIRGLRTLMTQLQECGAIPKWNPEDDPVVKEAMEKNSYSDGYSNGYSNGRAKK